MADLPLGAVEAKVRMTTVRAAILAEHGSFRTLTANEIIIIARGMDAIVEAIRSRWPVDTGTSKDAWNAELFPTALGLSGEYGFTIENPMFYAIYVFREGDRSKTPIWEELIRQAVSALLPIINQAVIAEIVRAEAEARAIAPDDSQSAFLGFL